METSTDVTNLAPLTIEEAVRLQKVELDRALSMMEQFDDAAWSSPTDCPGWDVRHMYLHVLGACEAGASRPESARQMWGAMRHRRAEGGPLEAALSHVQIAARHHLTAKDLFARLSAVAPTTIQRRAALPRPLRRLTMKVDGPVTERWTLGYLTGTIYLRDLWMHRVDAARATGVALELSPDHDGIVVADVVAEWARRHGQPFSLVLTGPAGGHYTGPGTTPHDGDRPEPIELDAVEFCRILAGRVPPPHRPLDTIVPF